MSTDPAQYETPADEVTRLKAQLAELQTREEARGTKPVITASPQAAQTLGKDGAFASLRLDALREAVTVTFRGRTWRTEIPDHFLLAFTRAVQAGLLDDALRLALGKSQYEQFTAMNPPPGFIDHAALANVIGESIQVGEG